MVSSCQDGPWSFQSARRSPLSFLQIVTVGTGGCGLAHQVFKADRNAYNAIIEKVAS
jgi:hypothetical protein